MAVRYLVPEGQHLPVSGEDGKPDHRLMAEAHAALFSNYRGEPYAGPDKEEAKSKLRALYKSEGMDWPGDGDAKASIVRDGLVRIAVAYSSPAGRTFLQGDTKFKLSDDDITEMGKNLDAREAPIDYEHNMAMAVAPPGFMKAAGWMGGPGRPSEIEPFVLKDGSPSKILWSWARFTPVMAAMVKQHEYRYFSPWFKWNDKDELGNGVGTRLKAGAMTNTPFLEELPAIEISDADYNGLFGFDGSALSAAPVLASVALSQKGAALISADTAHIVTREHNSPAAAGKSGGNMAATKLCMKCSADGKHQAFDGDGDGANQVGEFDEKHLKQYATNHLGMVPGGDDAKAKQEAAEAAVGALLKDVGCEGKSVDDLAEIVRAHAEAQKNAKPDYTVLLKEVVGADGKVDDAKLRAMSKEGGARADFAWNIRDAEAAVAEAFKAGRLKPSEKNQARELYLTDKAKFDTFVSGRRVVDVEVRGVAGGGAGGNDAARVMLKQKVSEYATQRKLTDDQALVEFTRTAEGSKLYDAAVTEERKESRKE